MSYHNDVRGLEDRVERRHELFLARSIHVDPSFQLGGSRTSRRVASSVLPAGQHAGPTKTTP
jgi:hypothetical protein